MSYWYHIESAGRPNRPLLLYLHGVQENAGDDVAQVTKHGPWLEGKHVKNASVFEELRGFFRVGPHLPGEKDYWNADLLRELILRIRRQEDVAPDGLFVVGISRGGKGALDFVVAHGKELGVNGVVVCCPQSVDNLKAALERTPIYLFHGDGDSVVLLNEAREREYANLSDRANFRWVKVHQSRTLGQRHHNCWTHLFGHPDLYRWFNRLSQDPEYRNTKDLWPDFADLFLPAS
jgi:predicted peptidase